jgi:hypothetical protein
MATETMDAIDRARSYGVRMDEALNSAEIDELRESVNHGVTVMWNDKRLARVLRLRLIGCSRDYPFWDVSYCYGELKDGTRCRVQMPGRINRNWKAHLVQMACRDGVFAKGLGLLDEGVVSRLYG